MAMLRLAYLANIVILVPVALATLASEQAMATVFEGKFAESAPLRVLVGCLWTAILVCSILGLVYPQEMIAILVMQVIYKALFLALVIIPLLSTTALASIPMGLSVSFALIVATYPFIIWSALANPMPSLFRG
jgi:hypothetical protein